MKETWFLCKPFDHLLRGYLRGPGVREAVLKLTAELAPTMQEKQIDLSISCSQKMASSMRKICSQNSKFNCEESKF